MITLYMNTEIYNTELTIQSDDEHKLIEILTNHSVRMFLNKDSYIGFEKYLNHNTTKSVLCSISKEGKDIYVMQDEVNNPYIVIFEPIEYGVKVRKYTTDDKTKFSIYNRMIRKYSLPLKEVN